MFLRCAESSIKSFEWNMIVVAVFRLIKVYSFFNQKFRMEYDRVFSFLLNEMYFFFIQKFRMEYDRGGSFPFD